MSEHTPGPWEASPGSHSIRATIEGEAVQLAAAFTSHFSTDSPRRHLNQLLSKQTRANVRLMAAAPELLAALEKTAAALDAHHQIDYGHYAECPICELPLSEEAARTAIQKARSKS